jgi:hypothetical protein
MVDPLFEMTRVSIAARRRRGNRRRSEADAALRVVGDQPERSAGGFGEFVHPSEVQLGKFEVGHGGFLGRGAAGAIEFFERTIGMMPD